MAHIRAMVVFQGATLIPEDRFINTLHFQMAGVELAAASSTLHPLITAFYNTATAGVSLGGSMSSIVNRTAEVRYYDQASAGSSVPVILPFTFPAASASAPLPEEVACVATFHGAPPVTPRTRGRIYLGPLNNSMVGLGVGAARISSTYRTAVAERCQALATAADNWVVYSPTSNVTTEVAGGFVDDAFDTMRKRGPKASSRTTWTYVD